MTKEQALDIVNKELISEERKYGIPLKIYEDITHEFDYGWVFFYQSKAYIETNDFGKMLGGNSPIIVDKENGNFLYTGTAKEVEYYIKQYIKFKKSGEETFPGWE